MRKLNFRSVIPLLLSLGLAACSAADEPEAGSPETAGSGVNVIASGEIEPNPTPTLVPAETLPLLGPAPDILNEQWLNTDQPLNLAALRGRVVLVEFWTFG